MSPASDKKLKSVPGMRVYYMYMVRHCYTVYSIIVHDHHNTIATEIKERFLDDPDTFYFFNYCLQVSETDLATPVDTPPAPPTPQSAQDTLSSLPEHPTSSGSELSSLELEIVQASKTILDTVRMRDFPSYK